MKKFFDNKLNEFAGMKKFSSLIISPFNKLIVLLSTCAKDKLAEKVILRLSNIMATLDLSA